MKEFLKDTTNLIASIIIICIIVIFTFVIGVNLGKGINNKISFNDGYKQALLDFKIIVP